MSEGWSLMDSETVMTVAELTKTYTPDDLLRLPDNNTMELVDGQIVDKQVSAESSEIEGWILGRFLIYLLEHPVSKVYPSSLGYQCFEDQPEKIRKPDVTVVRIERMQALADPDPVYMPLVPDLAVEVISPNDVVYDVDNKVQEYLAAGFPLVWVADPNFRIITVYPQRARPTIFTADDEISAESAIPGFRCKVADFFPAPPASKI
jgi:Uma2 family endonuclease